ncbi:MAG: co-chaperone GroES [Alphaproteobacteria bacterium]|nr:MAG: co-chaperone GroES [Alphaproteobacteria bacterium]
MVMKPLHDRVLIRRVEAEEKTAGGIIIPDSVQDKPSEGLVIATGPGVRNKAGDLVPVAVETGNHVLFSPYAGTEVRIQGEDLLIVNEGDVIGIVS